MSSTIDFDMKYYTVLPVDFNGDIVILKEFCSDEEAISLLQNFSSDEINELISILLTEMSIHPNYGKPVLNPVYYEDSYEIAYIRIIFENCNWDEWKDLELEFLSKENSIKGKVAVTCLQGLIE